MAPIISRPAPERPASDEEKELIIAAHGVYALVTRIALPLTTARAGHWCAWLRRVGANDQALADLKLVLRYLVREVDAERRNAGCLKLQNLIMKPEQWEDDLAFARRARGKLTKPAADPAAAEVPAVMSDADRAAGAEALRRFREGMRKTPASTLPPVQTPETPSEGAQAPANARGRPIF